ncbi:TonB-dependent receptor [Flavisolibacter nicotianae]|uniref:TonB-dependent receptor n=1 Tax=Flavisolibacter nicotianae TaxID=2364882 RepID=UPI000EACB985|nr:TonB-dependent receptor [Flavisolibacter nicotianae]
MRIKRLLLVTLAALFSFVSAFSQETTSEIQGVVTGENGQGLQGATIAAIHLPTGTRYSTSTRADGRYNLPNVRVGGPYEITVTYVGYQASTQKDITLSLGTAYKADFKLTANTGNLTEVTVSTTRSDRVFSRSRTGASEVINRSQLDRLPTVSRSLQDFTRLAPTANGLSFGGRSSSYNNLTVNGASFNNTFGLSGTLGGQTNSQPISLDALDQVQVNIAPYDVTLGSFTGAGINSVTRSGTNNYRGSVYYYWRNPYLTGTHVGTASLPSQDFNYYSTGANLGGYLVKNKLFYFVSYERERLAQPATSFMASRTGKPAVPGVISQANGDTLDALRSFLVSKYGYDPGPYENYNYNTNADRATVRLDYNINAKNTFTINYFYLKSNRNVVPSTSGSLQGGRTASNTGMPFFASSYVINNNFNIVIAELNSRISSTLSNKLQVGYNRLRDFRSSPGGIFPMVDIGNGSGSTYTSFGYEPFTANNLLNTDTYQFNDIVSLFHGKHNFTFGTQNTYNKFRNGFAPNYYGAYQFPTLAAFYDAAINGAQTATRYELRYSARKGGEFPFADVNALQLGFFAQDRWNATDNLVVTAGLRADLPIFGNSFGDNVNADALVYRNGVRINTGRKPKTAVLWSPRLGFNWDAKGDKTVQVRGGLGVFAGAPPFVWITNQASNNGVDFGSFVKTSGIAFSNDVNANRPANATANTSYNLAVTDENFKFPQIFRSNLAVDKRIFWDITATLEGIYTKDVNAVYHQNVNLPSTGAPLLGADNRIRYTSSQIYNGAGGATATNPNISDAILMTNTSKGYSYNLTGQLQRNVNNLYTMIAYTYGKSKSVNDGGSIAQSIWRDRPVSGDPNLPELGYSNYNQPHRVVAAAYYRKEYLKHFATSVGFTFEAANGGTASYTYNGDLNNDGLTGNDLVYVPRSQSEIVLVADGATDTRSTNVIWNQLNAYINQDPYLYKKRGEYVERNGLMLPFYKRLDLNFTQDFLIRVNKKTNTFRFTADIYNFGNLINKNWGIFRTTSKSLGSGNNFALLTYKGIVASGADAGKPSFSFPYLDAASQTPLVNTFQNSTSQASRFQVQLGIRYIFQ